MLKLIFMFLSRTEAPRPLKRVAVAAIAAFVLGACDSDPTITPTPDPTEQVLQPLRGMHPCYNSPIHAKLLEALEPTPPSPLRLQEAQPGRVIGDPGRLKPNIRQKVAGATVRVFNVGAPATGFLLQPDLVIAAAHTAATASYDTMDIEDSAGNFSKVIDGCHIYEKDGKQADPMDKAGAGVDIAVLRLAKPLGSSTLSLATTEVNQGDWVTFFNYQHTRPINRPAEYNGVVLADKPDIAGNVALTGLQGWRDCEPVGDKSSDCSIEPGASGGPVVSWDTGEVIGISVRGTAEGRLSEQDMLGYGAVANFATSPGTGYQPRIALTSSARAIRAAVDALQ